MSADLINATNERYKISDKAYKTTKYLNMICEQRNLVIKNLDETRTHIRLCKIFGSSKCEMISTNAVTMYSEKLLELDKKYTDALRQDVLSQIELIHAVKVCSKLMNEQFNLKQ